MDGNVRTQNVRDFTVAICHSTKKDKIVGTGIVVDSDKIVTCAHVVVAAGVNPLLGKKIHRWWLLAAKSLLGRKVDNVLADAPSAEVGVVFCLQALGGEKKERRARVLSVSPEDEDDIVVLQLVDGTGPLGPENFAVLGIAKLSEGHKFRTWGYTRLGSLVGIRAEGIILGTIGRKQDRRQRSDPIQLQSGIIDEGMSGAAVLDVERNLVVGLVVDVYKPNKDKPTYYISLGVDAYVLTLDPHCLPVRDLPLPMRSAPQPMIDLPEAIAVVAPNRGIAWNNAPPPLQEWVGRDDLLRSITADWSDPNLRVTGLIGFGGEGKSSLARKWLDSLTPLLPLGEGPGMMAKPDSVFVFWWSFYESPSVDDFFGSALKFMIGDRIDLSTLPYAKAKAHIIAAKLYTGRYLFVLDGLEVMQHQDGGLFGMLKNDNLREFLGYFAAPGHASFCLVTTRVPLLDLMEYTTYTDRDVDRLSPADGRGLLRNIGVMGSDEKLDRVVADWDGHALTLSLLGTLLTERHEGDVAHIADLPAPIAGEPRHERVRRVLRRYDENLTELEKAFLKLFSAFRTPVHEDAFDKVFQPFLSSSFGIEVGREGLTDLAKRLVTYRILRHGPGTSEYTAHPLIRAHYFTLLTQGDHTATLAAHRFISNYYLSITGYTPQYPTLGDLRSLIEAVHHACRAGSYNEAYKIYNRFGQDCLLQQLCAYETALDLMRGFFSDGDASQDPQVGDPHDKHCILNLVGNCLMHLGRLGEATLFLERTVAGFLADQNWGFAARTYHGLAQLHTHIGALTASEDAANKSLVLANREGYKGIEWHSLAVHAWANHLRGELEAAGLGFAQAEELQREFYPRENYLFGPSGILHADHLRRMGDANYARRVTDENLKICNQENWQDTISMCYRSLGDLEADADPPERARRQHYDTALKIARGISDRCSIIEALLARGRFLARQTTIAKVSETSQWLGSGFDDLNEALSYALAGRYRIYEADIRIALAWAHLAAANSPRPLEMRQGEVEAACMQAKRARAISEDMGYHWGKMDASEVLGAIDYRSPQIVPEI